MKTVIILFHVLMSHLVTSCTSNSASAGVVDSGEFNSLKIWAKEAEKTAQDHFERANSQNDYHEDFASTFQTSRGVYSVSTLKPKKNNDSEYWFMAPSKGGYFLVPSMRWVQEPAKIQKILIEDFKKGKTSPLVPTKPDLIQMSNKP